MLPTSPLRAPSLSRSCRIGLASVIVGAVLAAGARVAAGEGTPLGIAFSRGVFKKSALDEAVKQGMVELVSSDVNKDVVRHLRVEVFENDKVATKAQTTLFALCESTFYQTLNAGRDLSRLTVEYVILDS
jgi:hypothetical protein